MGSAMEILLRFSDSIALFGREDVYFGSWFQSLSLSLWVDRIHRFKAAEKHCGVFSHHGSLSLPATKASV